MSGKKPCCEATTKDTMVNILKKQGITPLLPFLKLA